MDTYRNPAGSGFYYLKTRYYDPNTGRFISSDVMLSTGQGVIGNNSYAYCLNNPASMNDGDGLLAYPGEVHNRVQNEVISYLASLGIVALPECIIDYENGTWGRADIISMDGQVWEIKRDKEKQINKGRKQIQNYIDGKWRRNRETELRKAGQP